MTKTDENICAKVNETLDILIPETEGDQMQHIKLFATGMVTIRQITGGTTLCYKHFLLQTGLRIRQEIFNYLCQQLRPAIEKQNTQLCSSL